MMMMMMWMMMMMMMMMLSMKQRDADADDTTPFQAGRRHHDHRPRKGRQGTPEVL
jgi:hypothetical protein